MKKLNIARYFIIGFILTACQNEYSKPSETETAAIINEAKLTVQKVFDASNNMEFIKGLDHYSGNSNAFYVSDGNILSLNDLKISYEQIGPNVEILHNTIEKWNAQFISKNTVSFTLPITLKIKLKGVPEYTGKIIWSAILQKNNNQWLVIQSHESWLNCAEVATALTASSD